MKQRSNRVRAWFPVAIALAGACGGTVVSTDMQQAGAGAGRGSAGEPPVTTVVMVGQAGSPSGVAGALEGDPPASFGGVSGCESSVTSSGVISNLEFGVDDRNSAGAGGDYGTVACPPTEPTAGTRCIGFIDCVYPTLSACPTRIAYCGTDGIWTTFSRPCNAASTGVLGCPKQVPIDGTTCSIPTNLESYSCTYASDCGSTISTCYAGGVWGYPEE